MVGLPHHPNYIHFWKKFKKKKMTSTPYHAIKKNATYFVTQLFVMSFKKNN